jgi:hypothetical protein
MNDLKIVVTGGAGTGKVSAAVLLYKIMTEYGMSVSLDNSIHDEVDSDFLESKTLTDLLQLLSGRNITIGTLQTAREPIGE